MNQFLTILVWTAFEYLVLRAVVAVAPETFGALLKALKLYPVP